MRPTEVFRHRQAASTWVSLSSLFFEPVDIPPRQQQRTFRDTRGLSVMWFLWETLTLERNYVFTPRSFNHLFLSAAREGCDHLRCEEARKPDLVSKITRAGSAALLLNGEKCWRANSSERNLRDTWLPLTLWKYKCISGRYGLFYHATRRNILYL